MPLFRSGSAKVQLLRSVPLFAGLSQRQLQQVAARGPRSATVVAETPMKLLVVGHREFWALLNQAPQLTAKVMRALSERLRQAERAHTA